MVAVSNGVPAELVNGKFLKRKMEDGAVLKMIWNSRVSKEKELCRF